MAGRYILTRLRDKSLKSSSATLGATALCSNEKDIQLQSPNSSRLDSRVFDSNNSSYSVDKEIDDKGVGADAGDTDEDVSSFFKLSNWLSCPQSIQSLRHN